MLVAIASIVLHGSATLPSASIATESAAARVAQVESAAHEHEGSHALAAEAETCQQVDGTGDMPGGHHGSQGQCCGICGHAAITPVLALPVANRAFADTVPSAVPAGRRGIVPEGLRRPPRPHGIA